MHKIIPLATALALLATLPALYAAPALAAPPPGPPIPKILVIDRSAILRISKVGQDVARQVQAYSNQAKADIAGQAKALQTEGQALQQQIAILAPDVKEKKIAAFEAKQNALQSQAQKKEALIQGALINAQQTMEKTLVPILQGLLQQRGANIILDKSAVVFIANPAPFDVTQAAVDQLNQKLPSLRVTLTSPPPGAIQSPQ